jgi:hypothetical protein
MNMKPVLKYIIISLVFSIVGACWALFDIFMLGCRLAIDLDRCINGVSIVVYCDRSI